MVSTYTASDPEGGTVCFCRCRAPTPASSTFDTDRRSHLQGSAQLRDACGRGQEQCIQRNGGCHRHGVDDNDNKNKMTATRAVTIMVTNVEENGTVTLSAQQPQVGVPITASVDDPDGSVTDITWQWYDVLRSPLIPDSNKVDEGTLGGNESAIAGATSATYTPTAADARQWRWHLWRRQASVGVGEVQGR